MKDNSTSEGKQTFLWCRKLQWRLKIRKLTCRSNASCRRLQSFGDCYRHQPIRMGARLLTTATKRRPSAYLGIHERPSCRTPRQQTGRYRKPCRCQVQEAFASCQIRNVFLINAPLPCAVRYFSAFLYPRLNEVDQPGSRQQTRKNANVYQNFQVVNDAVLTGIAKLLQDPRPTLEEKDLGSSKIAASLSLGLCCKI